MAQTFRPVSFTRGELTVPGRVHSWIFWRDIFAGRVPDYSWIPKAMKEAGWSWPGGSVVDWFEAVEKVYNVSGCSMCGGTGSIHDDFGYYYCMCHLLREKEKAAVDLYNSRVASTWKAESMDKFEAWGDKEQSASFTEAVTSIRKWIDYPTSWLILSGPTGSGKTFVLGAIMAAWKQIALYVEAGKFEDLVFSGMREQDLELKLNAMRNVPILVLDDLGIEYNSKIVAVNLDKVLQFRAKEENYLDSITVIATNFKALDLTKRMAIDGISRGASRLLDGRTLSVGMEPHGTVQYGQTAANDYRMKRRIEGHNGSVG